MRSHVVAVPHAATLPFETTDPDDRDQPTDSSRGSGRLQLPSVICVARKLCQLNQCDARLRLALNLELLQRPRQTVGQSRLTVDCVARHFQLDAILLVCSYDRRVNLFHSAMQELFFRLIELDLFPQLHQAAVRCDSMLFAGFFTQLRPEIAHDLFKICHKELTVFVQSRESRGIIASDDFPHLLNL